MSWNLTPHWSCARRLSSCVNVADVTQLSSPCPSYCLVQKVWNIVWYIYWNKWNKFQNFVYMVPTSM